MNMFAKRLIKSMVFGINSRRSTEYFLSCFCREFFTKDFRKSTQLDEEIVVSDNLSRLFCFDLIENSTYRTQVNSLNVNFVAIHSVNFSHMPSFHSKSASPVAYYEFRYIFRMINTMLAKFKVYFTQYFDQTWVCAVLSLLECLTIKNTKREKRASILF